MSGFFGKKKTQPTGAEMAEEGLRQVAIAIRNGTIEVERGRIFGDIYAHADSPTGAPRVTYVQFDPESGQEVIARCVILLDRAQGDLPIWQIDWAVLKQYRGKGIGKSIATKALREFTAGMKGKFPSGFAIEAIVDENNEASKALAKALIGGEKVFFDKTVSRNTYSFLKKYGA